MPSDLVIRSITVAPPEPANAPAERGVQATPAANAGPILPTNPDLLPNPTLRLDPTLGLVVIEFHNSAGELTHTIPGQRQLDAYRMARELNDASDPKSGSAPPVYPSATRTV